jgi:hypothetical protein
MTCGSRPGGRGNIDGVVGLGRTVRRPMASSSYWLLWLRRIVIVIHRAPLMNIIVRTMAVAMMPMIVPLLYGLGLGVVVGRLSREFW